MKYKNMLDPHRLTVRWTAGQKGLCVADSTTTLLKDRNFELTGTNVVDGACTYDADHGLLLTTQGAGTDQAAILPQAAADNVSLFREINWSPEDEIEFECVIRTGTMANTVIMGAGLLLTFPATFVEGDDNDRVVFNALEGTDTTWQIAVNIGGTDITADTGIRVVANTVYHFAIRVDAGRRAHSFINGMEVHVSDPLTSGAALLPCVFVEEKTAVAKTLHVRSVAMSRKWSD